MKKSTQLKILVLSLFCLGILLAEPSFGKQLTWKPGEENVTLYLPADGLEPGDSISLDGQQGKYLGMDDHGIIQLELGGNIEHYQSVPQEMIGVGKKSRSLLPSM